MKVEEVRALGKALLLSRANVNNCSTLLSLLASSKSLECLLEAVRCLQAFFLPILSPQGVLGKPQVDDPDPAHGIYRTWLLDKYEEFTQLLIAFVAASDESSLQTAALDALMELLQAKGGGLDNAVYFKLCSALAETRHPNDNVSELLATEYWKELSVCFLTVLNFGKIIASKVRKGEEALSSGDDLDENERDGVSIHRFVRNVYGIIARLSSPIQDALNNEKSRVDKSKAAEGIWEKEVEIKLFKSKVRKLWLSFLQLSLPLDVYKKVLADMSTVILPTLANPLRFSDFLLKSYDIGGLYSVLALDGVYILMTKYGMEYPEFYDKLYALLEPSIFFTKYRSRFFELLDKCLKSPLLPAYVAAAFAKKLSRLALSASPAGALVVIAMVHNLLRRHPAINCLVHQISGTPDGENATEDDDTVKENPAGKDPFLANETRTSECRALESSLWEIESLRRHYCPAVSRFVSSLETDLTVRARTSEVEITDFSSGSYSTIFREETKRRLKQVPLAYYKVVPKALLSESSEDFAGWSFSNETRSKRLRVM